MKRAPVLARPLDDMRAPAAWATTMLESASRD
jgi:hypothetical protein